MTPPPVFKKDDPLFQLLREGLIDTFNKRKNAGEDCDLTNCDFRNADLRGMDCCGLDLTGCYFRRADLRGLDFSESLLDGASIHDAKISGTFFPVGISAEEVRLSHDLGTRMRMYKMEALTKG